jgi:hypothetical protein
MARIYRFGSGLTPVNDAEFYTPIMAVDYREAYFNIRFYSDAGITPVIPTGGIVSFKASDDRETPYRYRLLIGGSFPADESDEDIRVQPTALGPIVSAKLTLSGITGATHFKAWVERV